jgi:mannonate dehydratase
MATALSCLPLAGCGEDWRLRNACRVALPGSVKNHPAYVSAWKGIDPRELWDVHVHIFGNGDSGADLALNPRMESVLAPMRYAQRLFFLNAGCVNEARGQVDRSVVARLANLTDDMPSGAKLMLLAFDWCHDEQGRQQPERSTFHVSNAYARSVAQARPGRFEWIASIHPYRPDALDALAEAAATGARAVKWLPSAMGMDPASPRCDAFYRALAKHNLPLLTHGGAEMAVTGAEAGAFGNPLRLRRALDQGVRVVIAHAASHGEDVDLDLGAHGPHVASFALFTRLFDDARYRESLYADISALGQPHRTAPLRTLLARTDWHARLLYGSDYPLPGVIPLYPLARLVDAGLLAPDAVPLLHTVRNANPLLFDFLLKRHLRFGDHRFGERVFATRGFFSVKDS